MRGGEKVLGDGIFMMGWTGWAPGWELFCEKKPRMIKLAREN
jgi:hypothetical protein